MKAKLRLDTSPKTATDPIGSFVGDGLSRKIGLEPLPPCVLRFRPNRVLRGTFKLSLVAR